MDRTSVQGSGPSRAPTPFKITPLGSLPNELLQTMTRCLNRQDLTAIARVSPELRDAAEGSLYTSIRVPHNRNLHARVGLGRDPEPTTQEQGLAF